ncbi:hypothetical protein CRUP_016790 [Coryphaenoides rupestris]|nr:hypothetical protein CRUP_016790 [Coryphaenoides rupestris]
MKAPVEPVAPRTHQGQERRHYCRRKHCASALRTQQEGGGGARALRRADLPGCPHRVLLGLVAQEASRLSRLSQSSRRRGITPRELSAALVLVQRRTRTRTRGRAAAVSSPPGHLEPLTPVRVSSPPGHLEPLTPPLTPVRVSSPPGHLEPLTPSEGLLSPPDTWSLEPLTPVRVSSPPRTPGASPLDTMGCGTSTATEPQAKPLEVETGKLSSFTVSSGLHDLISQLLEPVVDPWLGRDTCYELIPVSESYSGPRISFPLSTLHARYALQLLWETKKLLKQMPNIVHTSTSYTKEITVCGRPRPARDRQVYGWPLPSDWTQVFCDLRANVRRCDVTAGPARTEGTRLMNYKRDLHGHLDDLLLIFYKNGLPSADTPYVFNGDFVDRGKQSMEVVLILFSYLLLYPDHMHLNRGNHEDHIMNLRWVADDEDHIMNLRWVADHEDHIMNLRWVADHEDHIMNLRWVADHEDHIMNLRLVADHEDHMMNLGYGFTKEVMQKYKTHGREILQLFQDVFSLLPIATVIDSKVLIVHGGISDQTDLDFLNSIERHKVHRTDMLTPRHTGPTC